MHPATVTKQQLVSFLTKKGYMFKTTVNNMDVYSKGGYADIGMPTLLVMDINIVKSQVFTDRLMFAEFILQL